MKFQVSGLPAVAAYSPEAMVLSLIFGVVAFVAVFASRKAKRVHERALEESLNEGGKMEEEWSEYRKLFPKAAETAEATAARGMPRNQMGHALRACVDEGRMVGKLIASARGTMDEGDRDDMLRVAGERLGVMMEVLNLTREGLKVS
ncbi:hypothetical protein [Prosthecobacter sp.]|uniref:hypothetical protein n=1 Tax=Prosthecobacter sp. TaxID=1965333 RepID=UPI0037845B93